MIDPSMSYIVWMAFAINGAFFASCCLLAFSVWRLPIYHPLSIFLAYHFLGFVARPYLVASNQGSFLWTRIGFTPEPSSIYLSILVTNISLLCVLFGFYASYQRLSPICKLGPVQFQVRFPVRFSAAAFILLFLGFYSTWSGFAGAGLDSVLAYGAIVDSSGGQRLEGTSGYFTALAEFVPSICVFLYLSKRFRLISILIIVTFIGLKLYGGAQRLSFVVIVVALFMIYHIERGYRYPRLLPVLVAIVIAIVFDVIGSDRYAARRIWLGEQSVSSILALYNSDRSSNMLTSDVVEFDVSTAAIHYIFKNNDYSYGTQYLRLLIWPIPRQIWTSKPVYTSLVNLNEYGNFLYLTTGVYADTFMILGFGVFPFAMVLLGYLFGRIYVLAMSSQNAIIYMFFWIFFIYAKTILRDGGVTVVYFWIFSMLPIVVLVKIGGVRLYRCGGKQLPMRSNQLVRRRRASRPLGSVGRAGVARSGG